MPEKWFELEQLKAKLDANNTLLEKLMADIRGLEQQARQAEDYENSPPGEGDCPASRKSVLQAGKR